MVLIIGGGLVGCETADYLSEKGKSVFVVRRSPRMASDMVPVLRRPLMDRLRLKGVKLFVEVKEERFNGNTFTFIDRNGKKVSIEFDTLILAAGRRPATEEWEELRSKIREIYFVGDISDPNGRIIGAITGGNIAGRSI
jgi:pyruvate/2-oxoglutarate dehydrogenase complex dihydrolipoamide dehydrogenase (E3) component